MKHQNGVTALRAALAAAGSRVEAGEERAKKKNYAERYSRALARVVADALRPNFRGITPRADGGRQETPARTSKGVKKLDVNYSTPELGLALGVSIKTINAKDPQGGRYTKNYTRVDNELRAEAVDYHTRQPFAVLVAAIFIPIDSCDDLKKVGGEGNASSFGQAVRVFRWRTNRSGPRDEEQLFEALYIGLYEPDGPLAGDVGFFDVMQRPPKAGRPEHLLRLEDFIGEITALYDTRNNPAFEWES